MNNLDKYDHMILDIIHQHKIENQCHIRLAVLERNFWKRIEEDTDLHVGKARIGERITRLYLDGLIQNKNGYMLTKKGREALSMEGERLAHVARSAITATKKGHPSRVAFFVDVSCERNERTQFSSRISSLGYFSRQKSSLLGSRTVMTVRPSSLTLMLGCSSLVFFFLAISLASGG